MWSCRFFHYDQQPKRSQLCKRDWAAVHWRAPKVSKASLESSCPGHIQSARCLQNIPDLLCTPWTVTRALESWSVAWICHLCIVSTVQYDPKPLDWLWIRGTTQCVIYIAHWKIPLKTIAALLIMKRRNMWRLESSDYSFLPLGPKTDKWIGVLLLQFPPAALVLDKAAKWSHQRDERPWSLIHASSVTLGAEDWS